MKCLGYRDKTLEINNKKMSKAYKIHCKAYYEKENEKGNEKGYLGSKKGYKEKKMLLRIFNKDT